MTDLVTDVVAVRRASREMVRELGFLTGRVWDTDLSHSQCHALVELSLRGPLSGNQLAELLRLDKSTTSRVVKELVTQRRVAATNDPGDRRRRRLELTGTGRRAVERINIRADVQAGDALTALAVEERRVVVAGLALYAKALKSSRQLREVTVRPIRRTDDRKMARVIRQVMPEFGACGPGFAINDAEVDTMYSAYRPPRAAYFVAERGRRFLGGAGVAPLAGGPNDVCELRKMYLAREGRGFGLGRVLLGRALDAARKMRFRRCYLETLRTMDQAQRLYRAYGFKPLDGPMGRTGHFGCDAYYVKDL